MICCALCHHMKLEAKEAQIKLENTVKLVKSLESRAVSPVIGNILLIAIAVIGGTIIFLYSQGFVSHAQVSGKPIIELIRFFGYDARAADSLMIHDGSMTPPNTAGSLSHEKKEVDDRVAVFVENKSIQKVIIAELRFAGKVYNFTGTSFTLDEYDGVSPGIGEFTILISASNLLLVSEKAEIQGGQLVTLVIDLQDSIKVGRDAQLRLETTHGSVWLHIIKIGDQFG